MRRRGGLTSARPPRVLGSPRRLLFAVSAWAALSSSPAPALARTAAQWGWDQSAVWPAAIRFLRVDRQFPIREKDEKAGYVVFDYLESGQSHRGTFEIVAAAADDPAGGTRIFVNLPSLAKRYEASLLDALAKKLREESGPPAVRRPPPPPVGPNAAPGTPPGSPPSPGSSARPDAGLEQLPRPPTITP